MNENQEILCNLCGKIYQIDDNDDFIPLINIEIIPNDQSLYFQDGLKYKLNICEKCLLENIFKNCAVNPEAVKYNLMTKEEIPLKDKNNDKTNEEQNNSI